MREPQAELRLIAGDPVGDRDLSGQLERTRRRLLLEIERPAAPAARRRRFRRIVPAAIVVTTAAAVAAALLPAGGSDRPDVLPAPVQAFAEELSGDGLLHVVTRTLAAIDRDGGRTVVPGERAELWYDLDGTRWRLRTGPVGSPGYAELVSDGWALDVVSSAREGPRGRPDRFAPAMRLQLTPFWLPRLQSALATGTARVAGLATVRGQPAYRVAFDLVPGDGIATDGDVFVARDDNAMLRIERSIPPWSRGSLPGMSRAEVLTYDVLPDTPANRRLLDLPSELRRIPGADAPMLIAPTAPVPTIPPAARPAPPDGST